MLSIFIPKLCFQTRFMRIVEKNNKTIVNDYILPFITFSNILSEA